MTLTPRDQRTEAWHSLQGLRKYGPEDQASLTEAMVDNGLDFVVETFPLQANVHGKFVKLENDRVIIRPETDRVPQAIYGIAGPQWRPVQNMEIAELLAPIMPQFSLSAIGSVNDGQDLIIALRSGNFEVNGEELSENLIMRDSKKPGVSINFKLFNTRLFCTNQLPSIGRANSFTSPIVHGAGASGQLKFQADILPLLEKARREARQSFSAMGQKHLDDDMIDAALAYIYPDERLPKRARTLHTLVLAEIDLASLDQTRVGELDQIWRNYQSAQERTLEQRKEAKLLLEEFNDLHGNLANTAWALFNAVGERADHSQGRADEQVAWSALFGQRATEKERAFTASMQLVDPTYANSVPDYTPTATARKARVSKPARVLTPEEQERAAQALQRRTEREARRAASGLTPEQERAQADVRRAEKANLRAAKLQEDLAKLQARQANLKAREEAARALLMGHQPVTAAN